jgi:BASS family bile acid:Na+ symporter
MFAKFAGYFYSEQGFLLQTMATAFPCYAAYCMVGYVRATGSLQEKRAGLIAMSYVNNVLVAVFAFQFFGSQVAALAALYNIPYYVGMVATKKIFIASDGLRKSPSSSASNPDYKTARFISLCCRPTNIIGIIVLVWSSC